MGERIGMDIVNMIWDRCVYAVELGDYDNVKMEMLQILAMELLSQKKNSMRRSRKIGRTDFRGSNGQLQTQDRTYGTDCQPVIKQVFELQGHMYEILWFLLQTVNVCIIFLLTWKLLMKQKVRKLWSHSRKPSCCIPSMMLEGKLAWTWRVETFCAKCKLWAERSVVNL